MEWKFTKKIEDMSPKETKERIRKGYEYTMPKLFIMPYLGSKEEVLYSSNDMVARCPATGIADVYSLSLKFTPNRGIPELKSLKLYINAYQDLPISHEHLCNKVHKDFVKQVKPSKLETTLIAAIRGGITTTCNCKYKK